MTVVWILIGVAAVLLLWVVLAYNALVRLRNEAEQGWANIDVQLRRRADLIPNLVETVKGYAAHERETFDEVTRALTLRQEPPSPAPKATSLGHGRVRPLTSCCRPRNDGPMPGRGTRDAAGADPRQSLAHAAALRPLPRPLPARRPRRVDPLRHR